MSRDGSSDVNPGENDHMRLIVCGQLIIVWYSAALHLAISGHLAHYATPNELDLQNQFPATNDRAPNAPPSHSLFNETRLRSPW
jgi:hypothetical protein